MNRKKKEEIAAAGLRRLMEVRAARARAEAQQRGHWRPVA